MSFEDSAMLESHKHCLRAETPRLWIFGYGSLLWKPDFEYNSCRVGYIKNYERKFNQGNETFRGTKERPGRVANLEKKMGSKVWGVAYEIVGRAEVTSVLRNLYIREIAGGGYDVMSMTFFPRHHNSHHNVHLHSSHSDPQIHSDNDENTQMNPHSNLDLSESHKHEHYQNNGLSTPRQIPSLPKHIVQQSDGHFSDVDSPYGSFSDDAMSESNFGSVASDDDLDSGMESESSEVSYNDKVTSSQEIKHYHDAKQMTETKKNTQDFSKKDIQKSKDDLEINHDPEDTLLSNTDSDSIQVLVFTATPENSLYLGSDTMSTMAKQIVEAKGSTGSNVEYVLRISEYIKESIPEDNDTFLFDLDTKIREELLRKKRSSIGHSSMQETNSSTPIPVMS